MSATETSALSIVDTRLLDHDDWLNARRSGIGGSDAAAICGLDNYRSPFAVWVDKTSTHPPNDTAGEAALWGNLLEPVVADQVAAREQLELSVEPHLLAHPEWPFMRANLDRVAFQTAADGRNSPGVYEGKTGGIWTAEGWADGQLPARYLIQIMHYLAVTGWDWAVCGVLIGGQRLEVRWIERDQALIDSLIAIETKFWERVESGTPPPLDGSEATTDLLGRLYEPVPGQTVTLDPNAVAELTTARAAAAEQEKAAKQEKDRISNELRALLGDATDAVTADGDRLFTWRPQSRTTVDTKRLKAEQPDIAEQYSRTTTSRVLRITKPNKETTK